MELVIDFISYLKIGIVIEEGTIFFVLLHIISIHLVIESVSLLHLIFLVCVNYSNLHTIYTHIYT